MSTFHLSFQVGAGLGGVGRGMGGVSAQGAREGTREPLQS